jgi:hypothetical protein
MWCGRVKGIVNRAKPVTITRNEGALLHTLPYVVHNWRNRYAAIGLGTDRAKWFGEDDSVVAACNLMSKHDNWNGLIMLRDAARKPRSARLRSAHPVGGVSRTNVAPPHGDS